MNSNTSPHPIPPLPDTACARCGAVDRPTIAPGNGPHAFRATCRHCGAFLQWVSQYTSAERAARRHQALTERAIHAMRGRAPTVAQLSYLRALGYTGPEPSDRAAAHVLIAAHLARHKGGGQ